MTVKEFSGPGSYYNICPLTIVLLSSDPITFEV